MRCILVQTVDSLDQSRHIFLPAQVSLLYVGRCALLLGVYWPCSEEENDEKEHTWVRG